MSKPTQLIIGLGSRARVGKDWAFKQIESAYGKHVKRFAFADALKQDVFQLLTSRAEIDVFNMGDRERQLARPVLVAYGEMMRAIQPNYWIDRLLLSMKIHGSRVPILVVTDVRYENEVDMVQSRGGVFIDINCPAVKPANASERKWSPICRAKADYVVNNNFDDNFAVELLEIIDGLGEPVDYGLFRWNDEETPVDAGVPNP